jgi:hypothetical protein
MAISLSTLPPLVTGLGVEAEVGGSSSAIVSSLAASWSRLLLLNSSPTSRPCPCQLALSSPAPAPGKVGLGSEEENRGEAEESKLQEFAKLSRLLVGAGQVDIERLDMRGHGEKAEFF